MSVAATRARSPGGEGAAARWWHVRRGVPWAPVLGCCAGAVLLALVTGRYPHVAGVTLPMTLSACAAAAGFLLDEVAGAVVAVTPRADRWRPASRLLVIALPVATWAAVLVQLPETTRGEASGWLLAGVAACLLTAGTASAATRAGAPRPGAALALAVVLLTSGPLVLGPLLDLATPYPFPDAHAWVPWFWAGAGLAGSALLARPWLRG